MSKVDAIRQRWAFDSDHKAHWGPRDRVPQQSLDDMAWLLAEVDRLTAERDRYKAALGECVRVFELCEPHEPSDAIQAPEDPLILELCKRIGFGAVMSSAARQWSRITELNGCPVDGDLSAFVCGPCRATVRNVLAIARKALGR